MYICIIDSPDQTEAVIDNPAEEPQLYYFAVSIEEGLKYAKQKMWDWAFNSNPDIVEGFDIETWYQTCISEDWRVRIVPMPGWIGAVK